MDTGALDWMAWTWQTAIFFGVIAALLVVMTVWELRSPGGNPRRGVLRIDTTRGDRLFVSLLAAAFLHLLWLAFIGTALWAAMLLSVVVAVLIFRYV